MKYLFAKGANDDNGSFFFFFFNSSTTFAVVPSLNVSSVTSTVTVLETKRKTEQNSWDFSY